MRRFLPIDLLFALAISYACGQQTNPSSAPAQKKPVPERVKVYAAGPDVTAPELLASDLPPISTEKCKVKKDGTVVLSLLVDATGRPRNIMFLRPIGSDLDRLALIVAGADRFNPGKFQGKPVVVATSLEVTIRSCVDEAEDSAGKTTYAWRFRETPRQKFEKAPNPPEEAVLAPGTVPRKEATRTAHRADYFGDAVTAPVLLYSVEAEYTNAAFRASIAGTCVISLLVDPQGMPENVRVLKSLNPGLDRNALDAVKKYRYLPAMRDGEPVPAVITVGVDFTIPNSTVVY
jgi:TonB family protein